MTNDKANLFLIGYRATGKSVVARLLAQRLDWQFVDADMLLEETYQQTIRQIFATEGEDGFREKEAAVLQKICHNSEQVVATGGGVILREDNCDLMQKTGCTICLTATPETIWERMQQDETTPQRRPDLADGGLDEIKKLLGHRKSLYAASADLIVSTEERSPARVADLIYRLRAGLNIS